MNRAVKKLHADRAALGRCIYDNRDKPGGKPHEAPFKAKRCRDCYEAALKSNRDAKKKARAA